MLIGLVVGAVAGGVAGGIAASKQGQNVLMGILIGAGVGALFGAALGASVGLIATGTIALTTGLSLGGIASVLGGTALGYMGGSNLVNAVYYTFLAKPIALDESRIVDGKNASYYVTDDGGYRHIGRWDRLNHTKAKTGESWYNLNAWNYNSEYSAHMYGWKAYADFGMFPNYAKNLAYADVFSNVVDTNLIIIPTILLAILGI